jgi:plasmid stability protein
MSLSITIENLDATLLARLQAEAARRGTDLGGVAREVLDRGLPPVVIHTPARPDAIDRLAGTWSEDEAAEFRRNTAAFEWIDEELWR